MTTQIVVRRFEAGDGPSVLRLASRLTTNAAPWRDAASVAVAVRRWVETSVQSAHDEAHAVFVAIVDGEVVGVVTAQEQAHWSGEVDAYVDELVTAHGSEGRGVARTLMSAVEAWARERGLPNVSLETSIRNTRALDFYRRAGFQEEEVRLTKRLAR